MQEYWVRNCLFLFGCSSLQFWLLKWNCDIFFKLLSKENLDNKEPENPVVYLSNLVKKLDVKNRNGLVALAIVNILVILLFKFYLKGTGLLSWIYLLVVLFSIFKLLC